MPDAPGNNPHPLSVQPRWPPRQGAGEIPCVYLVGAGPGAPDLMTVRAANLVQAADAVFHDELVPRAILERVGPAAELVCVGHRAGGSKPEVGVVAEAMAARALAGDLVVRLKGGDPFLFGRGGEEAAALLDAGVAFELVPGVSSALAAPAAAGIPVTHRLMAASVTIITGHEAQGETERVRWDALATASDTLVVMMGAGRLRQLSARIMAAGRSPETPAAVVMAASRPEQRQVVAPLDGIAEAARAAGIGAPAVLIVGEVVELAHSLGRSLVEELAVAGAELL